jgi:predicted  nucleic acid-binding Zn-ribbon protein
MGTDEEQAREQWRGVITRIAAQIDDFKRRIDGESEQLYKKLSAEIAILQSELRSLEAQVLAVDLDAYARQITTQIEDLRAKGDAAYDLLQTWIVTELDPAEAEIRRLEAIAESATPDAKAKIMARIGELKAARASIPHGERTQNGSEQPAETPS